MSRSLRLFGVSLFLFLACAQADAQRRNRFVPFTHETQFSVGPELAAVFPSGFGIGATLRYEQPFKMVDHLTVIATVGFISYGSSTTYDAGNGTTYTARSSAIFAPILGGAKYYYPGPLFHGLYGSFEAGYGIGSLSVSSYSGSTPQGQLRTPDAVAGVVICPGAGFHNGQFDFSLRYFSVGLIAIRAAYVFHLK